MESCVIIALVLLIAWGSLGWWVPSRTRKRKQPELVQGWVIEDQRPGRRYSFVVPLEVAEKAAKTGDYKVIQRAGVDDAGNHYASNSRFDNVWIPGGFIEDGVEYQDERLNE